MPDTYTINGVVYRQIEQSKSTLANDLYVMKQARSVGLYCVQQAGETEEDFSSRLLSIVIDKGVTFELIGGLIIPEHVPDEQWTEALAEDTANRLRTVTAANDKNTVLKIIVMAVSDFFAAGLRSQGLSLPVSQAEAEASGAMPGAMNSFMTSGNGAALSVN